MDILRRRLAKLTNSKVISSKEIYATSTSRESLHKFKSINTLKKVIFIRDLLICATGAQNNGGYQSLGKHRISSDVT